MTALATMLEPPALGQKPAATAVAIVEGEESNLASSAVVQTLPLSYIDDLMIVPDIHA